MFDGTNLDPISDVAHDRYMFGLHDYYLSKLIETMVLTKTGRVACLSDSKYAVIVGRG